MDVASGLDIGEGLDSFLITADLGEPSGGSREERKAKHEEDAGDELSSPCSSERGSAFNLAAAVADEVPKSLG